MVQAWQCCSLSFPTTSLRVTGTSPVRCLSCRSMPVAYTARQAPPCPLMYQDRLTLGHTGTEKFCVILQAESQPHPGSCALKRSCSETVSDASAPPGGDTRPAKRRRAAAAVAAQVVHSGLSGDIRGKGQSCALAIVGSQHLPPMDCNARVPRECRLPLLW